MQERSALAAPSGDAVRHQPQDFVEALARQAGIRCRATHQVEQASFVPFFGRAFGDDLLCQHVERRYRHVQHVEPPGVHRSQERRALDQLVARERVKLADWRRESVVAGAADPLQKSRNAARRADLAHQLDRSDIDTELERGGGDQHLQRTIAQQLLDARAAIFRKAAVMRGDVFGADAFGQ